MSLKGFRQVYCSALLSVSNPFIFSNYSTRCMIEHNKCLWLNIRFSVDACLSLPSSPVMVYRALALDFSPAPREDSRTCRKGGGIEICDTNNPDAHSCTSPPYIMSHWNTLTTCSVISLPGACHANRISE